MTYFLPQSHTSKASPKSTTNQGSTIQMLIILGEISPPNKPKTLCVINNMKEKCDMPFNLFTVYFSMGKLSHTISVVIYSYSFS